MIIYSKTVQEVFFKPNARQPSISDIWIRDAQTVSLKKNLMFHHWTKLLGGKNCAALLHTSTVKVLNLWQIYITFIFIT